MFDKNNLPDSCFSREAFETRFCASREALLKISCYFDLLQNWQARINLISSQSLPVIWRRHFWDSAQLLDRLPPRAGYICDIGSGAGFPGLVLALLAPHIHLTLIESDKRKATFLREVILATQIENRVAVINKRVENVKGSDFVRPVDVITARALAPLSKLLQLAMHIIDVNRSAFRDYQPPLALFHKGTGLQNELTEAESGWYIACDRHQSETDPQAAILEVHTFTRK